MSIPLRIALAEPLDLAEAKRRRRANEHRAFAQPLPADHFENEVRLAMANISRNGSSALSSDRVLAEAWRRLAMETPKTP